MTFRFAELVGRYRLVVSDALLEFVERTFVEAAPPSDRERVRAEALAEARSAALLVESDGTLVSSAGDIEFYRVKIDVNDRPVAALHFDKAPLSPVTLVLETRERLVAHQPNKPPAEFRRVP